MTTPLFEGVFDLEGNGLLDHTTINYLASPFKLKPTYSMHCGVITDIHSGEEWLYVFGDPEQREAFKKKFLELDHIIGHNILDYDLLALKLWLPLDYELIGPGCGRFGVRARVEGREVYITDTLVVSKALNPDRYLGHSLDEWGKRLGELKIDWRGKAIELGLIQPHAPKGAEFAVYHPEMLVYNAQDCKTNVKLYWKLVEEMGDHPWTDALELEHFTRDLITRQSHRGFWFDSQLAGENIRDLDTKMEAIRLIVEPLLPPKPMGVTKLKEFLPPKIQFKKDGTLSANILKWVEKHGGELIEVDGKWVANIFDKMWPLPMKLDVPVKTHEPSTVKDTTHIKSWLVTIGWRPTQYKERDLTVDTKKQKLPADKFKTAVVRYVEQTLASPFCRDRCEALDTSKGRIYDYLLSRDQKRPLKVYTNPTFTVGQEKELDPSLAKLFDQFPHVKLIVEFLTYQHRRNSILGGGFDPDDIDEDDEFAGKGYLAADRIQEDGRIPTPADTCGAGTSRFKHRLVANIPRVTSLYGAKMRALFGTDVSEGYYQMGYDFASLEAMIESHYCWKYDDEDKSYCNSLTREKPLDVHTITAKKIAEVIGQDFTRTAAKPVKYACAYGAQPKRVAKTVGCSEDIGKLIHAAYWEAAKPLAALSENLKRYWETTGMKKFVLGLDKRLIPTRSASALINSLFQSAGVICAKRAMVIHERKLKEAGLWVDFFREDWKAKPHVQQLIAYHDEAQMEVHKSLIQWKVFPTEAEAKAFKSENLGWSEVGHSNKGFYIGLTKAGTLIQEAVKETSEYYKLNVNLSADYILGRNWAECH